MSITFTITLNDAQHKALAYVANSPSEWVENLVFARCESAIDEIVALSVERCLAQEIQLPGSKDEIILLAKTQGWLNRQGK
jgi:hypothetical protein